MKISNSTASFFLSARLWNYKYDWAVAAASSARTCNFQKFLAQRTKKKSFACSLRHKTDKHPWHFPLCQLRENSPFQMFYIKIATHFVLYGLANFTMLIYKKYFYNFGMQHEIPQLSYSDLHCVTDIIVSLIIFWFNYKNDVLDILTFS